MLILRVLSIVDEAPEAVLIILAAFGTSLLLGLVLHEYMHARVADYLGDHTARMLGRLSLDPRRHYDPIGSTLIFVIGFGWAKPVPVNPMNTRNPQRSMVLIAAAGPLTNLVVAGIAAIPIRAGWVPFFHPFVSDRQAALAASVWTASPENLLGLFLGSIVLLNVLLGLFNLVPLFPLDGSRVLAGLLPRDLAREYERLAPWMPGILILLIALPFMTGGEINPLADLLGPPLEFALHLFVGRDTSPLLVEA